MTTPDLPQYEVPDDAAKIALWKARLPEQFQGPGNYVGGAELLNFKQGWAKSLFNGTQRAHWFVRSRTDTESLCGVISENRWIYGPGNYPRCTFCVRKMTRMIRRGDM